MKSILKRRAFLWGTLFCVTVVITIMLRFSFVPDARTKAPAFPPDGENTALQLTSHPPSYKNTSVSKLRAFSEKAGLTDGDKERIKQVVIRASREASAGAEAERYPSLPTDEYHELVERERRKLNQGEISDSKTLFQAWLEENGTSQDAFMEALFSGSEEGRQLRADIGVGKVPAPSLQAILSYQAGKAKKSEGSSNHGASD
jgi:hypothetical protein